jgi:hypothetical protein
MGSKVGWLFASAMYTKSWKPLSVHDTSTKGKTARKIHSSRVKKAIFEEERMTSKTRVLIRHNFGLTDLPWERKTM